MAKTLEAHDKLIREIFEGSYQFEIPDYQRPYAWTTEQATELFDDLYSAMQSSQQRSVHDLLKEKLPGPLEGQWAVTAAQVNLYYPPEPGRTRPKVVTIEVTSKGRLNLHKFDAKMQAQLEGYLVAVGILQKGQTLSAQELPPETDAVSSSSAYED